MITRYLDPWGSALGLQRPWTPTLESSGQEKDESHQRQVQAR